MCVKLPPENLNPDLYPPYPTNTYTCGVTTASRNIIWGLFIITTNNFFILFYGIMSYNFSGKVGIESSFIMASIKAQHQKFNNHCQSSTHLKNIQQIKI